MAALLALTRALALALALLTGAAAEFTNGCVGPVAGVGPELLTVGQQCPVDSAAVTNARVDSRGNLYFLALSSRTHDGTTVYKTQVRMLTPAGNCLIVLGSASFIPSALPASCSMLGAPVVNADPQSLCIVYAFGLAIDYNDDVIVADSLNGRVLRISAATSLVSTIAGIGANYIEAGYSGDGGSALLAQLSFPMAVCADALFHGAYFVFDNNAVVRRIDSAGVIQTVFSSVGCTHDGAGSAATSACLQQSAVNNQVNDLVALPTGGFVITDYSGNRVLRVMPLAGAGPNAFTYSVVYGDFCTNGDDDYYSHGTASCLYQPRGIALVSLSTLYVTDVVLTASVEGVTSIVNRTMRLSSINLTAADAGNAALVPTRAPARAFVGGDFTSASLYALPAPTTINGVAASAGSLVVAYGFAGVVALVDAASGATTTLAQTAPPPFGGDGGPASSAALFQPQGVAVSQTGAVYVADTGNHRIRMVSPSGSISTVAGGVMPLCFTLFDGTMTCTCPPLPANHGDGLAATAACLVSPVSVAINFVGDIVIAEGTRVRHVSSLTGIITTLAAGLSAPSSVAIDTTVAATSSTNSSNSSIGFVVVADAANASQTAAFNADVQSGAAISPNGWDGQRIYRFPISGLGTHPLSFYAIAGTGSLCASSFCGSDTCSSGDTGEGSSYSLTTAPALAVCVNQPTGLAVQAFASGAAFAPANVFYLDSAWGRVRMLTPQSAGIGGAPPLYLVTTLAGTGCSQLGCYALETQTQEDAFSAWDLSLSLYSSIALDSAAQLIYISDSYNDVVRSMPLAYTYSTSGPSVSSPPQLSVVAGMYSLYGDGGDFADASASVLTFPGGLAVDRFGNLLLCDVFNSRVRAIVSGTNINCAAGFACTCVVPTPCTGNASLYCPLNSVTPSVTMLGYATTTDSAGNNVAPAQCATGSFCLGGVSQACRPGTYGLLPRQFSESACLDCPSSTYSALPGSSGKASCLPCPATSNATAGAGQCTWTAASCQAGAFAFIGPFGGCVVAPSASSVTAVGDSFTVNLPPSAFPIDRGDSAARQVTVGVAISFVLGIPAIVGFIALSLWALGFVEEENPTLKHFVWPFLRFFDQIGDWQIGAQHTDPRKSFGRPVHLVSTATGGMCSSAAIAVIFGFAGVLIVVFFGPENILFNSFVLPQRPELFEDFEHAPFFSLPAPVAPLLKLSQGLLVSVAVMGPACGNFSLKEAQLVDSEFTHSVTTTSSSALFVHDFACEDCSFGSLSQLSVAFSGSCQSLAFAIGSVSARGAVSLASFNAAPPESAFITAVSLAVTPMIDVVRDRTILPSGVSRMPPATGAALNRGIVFTTSSFVVQANASLPAVVELVISLSASPTFTGNLFDQKFLAIDLIYQLLATLAFGAFFTLSFLVRFSGAPFQMCPVSSFSPAHNRQSPSVSSGWSSSTGRGSTTSFIPRTRRKSATATCGLGAASAACQSTWRPTTTRPRRRPRAFRSRTRWPSCVLRPRLCMRLRLGVQSRTHRRRRTLHRRLDADENPRTKK